MSIKWSLLYKMTGSLWLGLGDHLFNNLASNLVHMVSNSEADSLQIVRIILWQLLSFAIVLWGYQRKNDSQSLATTTNWRFSMPMYEFCAENVTYLEKAFQAGAQRVELCDNLAVGGTTPSYGVIKAAVELAKIIRLSDCNDPSTRGRLCL